MAGNNSLHEAKVQKNDEFYTRLVDIENELGHYTEHFKDKVVLCNCDDPEYSNFCKYFALNFNYLGLKKLITTHYEKGKQSYKWMIRLDSFRSRRRYKHRFKVTVISEVKSVLRF